MNPRTRRKRAILRCRRRGTTGPRGSWLFALDPFKVLQGVNITDLRMDEEPQLFVPLDGYALFLAHRYAGRS